MKTSDTMLENCMTWLTDISIYRSRLNRLQSQLSNLRNKYMLEGNFDLYVALAQKFSSTANRLKVIEGKVIHTMNKRLHELYKPKKETWAAIENELDLFDNMMLANSMIIDLQRSITLAHRPQEPVKFLEAQHPSIVVDMAAAPANAGKRV